ncbi:MAG: type IV pili twitching motility protein PilT [Elusimicrobia bacterium RIFOXYB12_FULL_50_12]|nr:MAG: type IV pili twitching motility protein PilT [Elusimicrobia bacterium RIFOXYA12_FULL_49_49]OGS09978.1 MAG: type IV pili twitching motility protein PilT [Elusimicrobia bacterium RIFOXYB1_FULL_48_9]OGS16397.1 MAG: type IV pili twitching motility protein PilT [Elusimicrobia bacterium RIFOXYA2_FULL_47_53]OGS27226.1 MAG: type IV pili twitching motility protein PilT [Elusimicrobia bacterium RIFOXYB12_FULL_50_12]OGS30426.1 MAG: type IV pili twitching motility protein PilT [Elusimicrobia bacter
MEMFDILKTAVDRNASDIHLVIGKPPMLRVRGSILAIEEMPVLSLEDSRKLIYSILNDDQKSKFEQNMELDCSFSLRGVSRFRVNVFMQKNGPEAVLRVISSKIPEPEELKLTPSILQFADMPRGLVLVTGPTGSGKSTTLACLLNLVNQKRYEHILTIEDPIEFVYENKNCIVRQREVGQQTKSFSNALKYALRQDPDVVLIGEMRDLETISAALTIAETGHLAFATLHTTDAAQTVDRIIDVFPPHQQQQVRVQLSVTLKGVVSQTLLPKADGIGRVAAREVMVVTPAISNLIREGKTHQIYSAIETGGKFGMISLDRAMLQLVQEGLVNMDDAVAKAHNPEYVKSGGKLSGL